MSASVTVKMTPREFDLLRQAVAEAKERQVQLVRDAKSRNLDRDLYQDHVNAEVDYGRLLKTCLS